jgi:hypothetical protein
MTPQERIDLLDALKPSKILLMQPMLKISHKTTIAWFKKAGIPLAEHPAQSPDINPIEPVWHELKKILRSQRCASTAEGLKSAICAGWDALPQEVID